MIKTGIKGYASENVEKKHTAKKLGSGELQVLATPAVIALIEKAAWQSVLFELEEGQGTVGTSAANAKIAGAPEGFDTFYGAPAILIVLADKSVPTHVCDGSLVIGNMMLAAHSLGLGSIWIHRAKEEFETDEYKQLLKDLGVEGDWEGIGHCAIGYIDGEAPEAAERKDGRVYWVE